MRNSYSTLPDNWTIATLGEVCDILDNQRIPVSSDERAKRGGDIPYYGANGQVGWIDDYLFDEELVLIAEDGGNFDEYTERAIAYRVFGRLWVNNHAHVLRAKPVTTNAWIYHNLVHKDIRYYIRGGTRSKLNQGELREIEIAFPPYNEQDAIAEILDTLDDAIQKTEQLINKLKQIKQGLLHDLLTRGTDENGQLRDPIAHPEQFKDSELGRIPREWDVPRIADIAIHVGSGVTPRGGSDVYKTEGVLFVRSQNVHFDGLRLDDVAYIDRRTHEQMSRSEIFPHDVLINITGASIGRCCAFPDGLGVANVNQHVCAIRTEAPNKDDAKFLSSVLSSHFGQSQIDRLNAGGNREGLNYEQLRSFVIPWPTQEERQRIAEILFSQDKRLSDEDSYLRKLALIKNGLTRDLLTGRVRTTQGE